MIKSHNSNMLVETVAFVALVITFGIYYYLILQKLIQRSAEYIHQNIRTKTTGKHKQANPKFIDYICLLKSRSFEVRLIAYVLLISVMIMSLIWIMYSSFGYQIYKTYPNIVFTDEYYHNLRSSLRSLLIIDLIMLVFILLLMIFQNCKDEKIINKEIRFYYHERETNEYLNNLLSSTTISLEQINDILLKHYLGLIDDSSLIKIREYCLSNPNTGISNYILTQTTKSDINLDDLLAAYELKKNGFIYDTVYLQIKHNFMHNAQISAYELNDLFEEIANKTIDVTPDEFAIKRIHLMNSMVDKGEKIKDIKMILEVIQDKGIISKEEYKLKLSQYRNK